QCSVAAEADGGFDFHADARGLVGELAAIVELLDAVGRFRFQPGRDLVLAPFRLDLVADLVEVALARGRDAEHVIPDIAAIELDRLVVDADIAAEGLRDHVEAARDILHGLAVRHPPGAIDGIDRDGGEPELLRGFGYAG